MTEKIDLIEFEKIVLSKDETKALRLLQSNNLLLDGKSKNELKRLLRLGLAEKYHTKWNGEPCFGVRISDRGKDFLMFSKRSRSNFRKESFRYWITTAIAAIALIKSFMPEISAGLAWLLKLLERQ